MRILLDTNVLIDYVARREPFFQDALKLRVAQAFGDVEWWVSPHSYLDALYILRRHVSAEKACSSLLATLDFANVCALGEGELRDALSSGWRDAEDCVVSRLCDAVDARYLVTRNVADFEKTQAKCVTPKEMLGILEKDHGLVYDEVLGELGI